MGCFIRSLIHSLFGDIRSCGLGLSEDFLGIFIVGMAAVMFFIIFSGGKNK